MFACKRYFPPARSLHPNHFCSCCYYYYYCVCVSSSHNLHCNHHRFYGEFPQATPFPPSDITPAHVVRSGHRSTRAQSSIPPPRSEQHTHQRLSVACATQPPRCVPLAHSSSSSHTQSSPHRHDRHMPSPAHAQSSEARSPATAASVVSAPAPAPFHHHHHKHTHARSTSATRECWRGCRA
jgi:hypothetical protein